MAMNFFYNKKSRTDGTYRKYLENELEAKKKSNENIRRRIKELEAEIKKNEEEIEWMKKEYSQLGRGEMPTNTTNSKSEDDDSKAANYGLVLIIGLITLFFAAILGSPMFAGLIICITGVVFVVALFR